MNDITIRENHTIVPDQQVNALKERIAVMKQFVQNQLVEGLNSDYAKIPGTLKPSLLKPGAEKLLLLFKLGFRFEIIDRQIDFAENVVSFLVKCIIFHKESKEDLGEYVGYCTNHEKKYIHMKAPDAVNTVLKMAEKRALVGATISVTGASDYFSQDLEGIKVKQNNDVDTSKFESNSGDVSNYVVEVGKFQGQKLKDIEKDQLTNYCKWITDNNSEITGKMKTLLDNAREYLRVA